MTKVADKSGPALYRLGDTDFEITGTDATVDFADVVLDCKTVDGTVYLTVGSSATEGTSKTIRICSRLRMSVVTAQNLRDFLGQSIETALNPPKPENPN